MRRKTITIRVMSEHHSLIQWNRTTDTFDYDDYNRHHKWTIKDGVQIPVSAAIDFKGTPSHLDPEEALVGALSSCHLLTFLALASKKRYTLDQYEDNAVGLLEENSDGIRSITTITLNPKAVFSGDRVPTDEDIKAMHEKAHKHCFIANSIKATVIINS